MSLGATEAGAAGAGATGALRHFADLDACSPAILRRILDLAKALKRDEPPEPPGARPLAGKILALVFEKPSTRTRVSFEVAAQQLGGSAVVLEQRGTHLQRGETIADTARVLSRYADAIMLRTSDAANLREMIDYAGVPVINGLTDRSHPCQLMADVMTLEEHLGPIAGKTVAWSGDGNNVAVSWIHAAVQFGFQLTIACPAALPPPDRELAWAHDHGGRITVTDDPRVAVRDADCVVTDTWVSMGDEAYENRHMLLTPFRVDEDLMKLAKPAAIFMHCLPAHRGEEVTADVIDGPQSVVWDEAENRLHAQKAILIWCLSDAWADA